MKRHLASHSSRATGFSLVEVTLALGIAAFCLVVLLGLIPAGINSNQASLEQTAAAGLAAAVVADLRATPRATPATPNPTSPRYGFTISAQAGKLATPETIYLAEDGSATGTVGVKPSTGSATAALSRYRVSLAFTDPPASPAKGPTGVRLLVTWPALSDADPTKPPAGYSGSFEVVTALDRN